MMVALDPSSWPQSSWPRTLLLLLLLVVLVVGQQAQQPPLRMELLITLPVEVDGECYCCAFLNAVNSSLSIRQSAEHFCRTYNETSTRQCVPSVLVSREDCADRVEVALLQRLRSSEHAIVLPVKVQFEMHYFYARSAWTVEDDVASFCTYHGIDHLGCRSTLRQGVQRHLIDTMPAHSASLSVKKDGDASRIYLWPVEHSDAFVRERVTIQEGLAEGRRVMQVINKTAADYVLYLITGPMTDGGSAVGRVDPSRLICLDYSDPPHLPPGLTTDSCRVIFKRSWVMKERGTVVGYPAFTREPNVFPLHYSTISQYWAPQQVRYAYRDISVTCTLRPTTSARRRVLGWVTEAVMAWGLSDAFMGQFSDTVRHTVDKQYQNLLGRSRIIVTANPEDWDGDMRTWEALASGALVMVDAMVTPFPPGLSLRHGVHVVVYDKQDREAFMSTLHYYLTHTHEASRIAKRGQRFALQHHGAGSRLDYIDVVARGFPGLINTSGWKLAQVDDIAAPANGSSTAQDHVERTSAEVWLDEEKEEEADKERQPPPWEALLSQVVDRQTA